MACRITGNWKCLRQGTCPGADGTRHSRLRPRLVWCTILLCGWGTAAVDAQERPPVVSKAGPGSGPITSPPMPSLTTNPAPVDDPTAGHPLLPAIAAAKECRDSLKEVKDYTAVFIKRELLGSQLTTQIMDLKFREKPFSVYMLFRGQEAGREVLYVAGANGGKLLVHEAGLKSIVGTLQFPPTSPEVMKENRHPITHFGMSNTLETIITQWQTETKYGEIDVKFYPQAKLGDTPCTVIESTHPRPRREFKFHITRLYLEKGTCLPLRVEQHTWPRNPGEPPVLVEEYTFTNLKVNVGLTPRDFDSRNPSYRF